MTTLHQTRHVSGYAWRVTRVTIGGLTQEVRTRMARGWRRLHLARLREAQHMLTRLASGD